MTRILVVDDDSVLQRTLRINLRARGHEVLLAGTGEQALHLFSPSLLTLSSSTSACPISTASRCSGACVSAQRSP